MASSDVENADGDSLVHEKVLDSIDDDTFDKDVRRGEEHVQIYQDMRRQQPRYFTVTGQTGGDMFHQPRRLHNVCYLCAGADHHAGSCTEEMCLVCLKRGHRSRDCPTNRRIAVCSICGRIGHQRADCTDVARPDVSDCRCITCRDWGHIDCSPFEERPRRVSCFNCGAAGHQALDCPRDGLDRWHDLFSYALGSKGKDGSSDRGKGGGKGSGKGGGKGSGKGGGKGGKDGSGDRSRGSSYVISNHVGRPPQRAHHGNGKRSGQGHDFVGGDFHRGKRARR